MKARHINQWMAWLLLGAFVLAATAWADDEPGSKPEKDTPAATKQPTTGSSEGEPPAKAAADRKSEEEYFELYKSLADTLDQVERNYVKPVDRRELMEAAIKGILTKLDPYSSYYGPDEMSGFRNTVESQFGGIGIQITPDEGGVRVTTPLVGTPAYRAGVQAGDRIIRIEGEQTRNLPLDEVVRRLKGEVGTSVTFTVLHALTGKTETFTVTRELVHVDTVLGDTRKDDDRWNFMLDPEKRIGYIRVTAFSRDTGADLKKALEDLQRQHMRGLILDLRFDPGGLLTSAIEVSDLFVSEGRIVSTKGRNTPERVWDATQTGTFAGFPMVVLVNRYSASASEIVAACLQDHNVAVVIGERTWGKGSVQNVIELEEGKTALKLTTATYTRPNGHNIHRFPDSKETDEWGVKPNDGLELKIPETEMAALLADRLERDIVRVKDRDEKLAAKSNDRKSDEPTSPQPAGKSADTAGAGKDAASTEGPTPEGVISTGKSNSTVAPKPAARESKSKFVDRQLQKAVDYLTTELAQAK